MYNISYGPEGSLTISIFINHLPGIMLNIFPIVVLISIVLSLINTLKTPANRGLAALFTLITASIIYYAGYTGLYSLEKISNPPPIVNTDHLYNDKISPLVNSSIFVTKQNGKKLAIEVKNKNKQSPFLVYKNVKYIQETNSLISENGEELTIDPSNPYFTKVFYPPKLFKSMLDDLSKIFIKIHHMYCLY